MKKTNCFKIAAAAVTLSLAACSQEDVIPSGGELITDDMATSYAMVKISMPPVMGTRGDFDDNPQFDSGTTEEAAVKSVKLVLYSEDGQAVGFGAPTQLDDFSRDQSNQNISDYKDVVFKFNLVKGAPVPTKVLAFINKDEESFNLAEIEQKSVLNTINTEDIYKKEKTTATNFVMTNAGYYDALDSYVIAADLQENALVSTPELAQTNGTKATIYVERLAAKITVKEKTGLSEDERKADVIVRDIENNQYTLTFQSENWGTTGIAKSMYLFKKKFGYNSSTDSWMNYLTGYRSFWAEGVNFDTTYSNGYVKDGKASTDILDYVAYQDVTNSFGSSDYAPEHTYNFNTLSQASGFNPLVASTSAIVVGHYKLEGKNAEEWFKDEGKSKPEDTRYDFYLRYVGMENGKPSYIIYNKSQLIAYMLNSLNGVDKLCIDEWGDEYFPAVNKYGYATQFDSKPLDLTQYLTVVKDVDGKYKLAWVEGQDDNLFGGEEHSESDKLLDENGYPCKNTSFSMHYNHGLSYFQVAIEHNSELGNKTGKYGVVRNHSYNLTVNKYIGLGGPLDEDNTDQNEDKPILPDPDATTAYLNATINVLSWHSLNQNVEF